MFDRSIGFDRLMRWGAGAIMLLLAHGLIMPGAARAACNHLVTSQFDRHHDFHRLDDLITGGASARSVDDPSGQPAPAGPRKCSGPGCSNGGVPWPASADSPTTAGPDQWIVLDSVRIPPAVSPPRHVPDEPTARPAGHKPSIFHPPPA